MKKRGVATLMLVALSLLAASCASVAELDGAGAALTLERLDESAIKNAYGSNLSRNPFIPFEGMLFRKRDEFIVVRLSVAEGAAMARFIGIEFVEPDGFKPAFLDKAALASYWEANTLDIDIASFRSDYDRRYASIRALCLSADENARVRPGKERVMVFSAASPLPESWSLDLAFIVDGERQVFAITSDHSAPRK